MKDSRTMSIKKDFNERQFKKPALLLCIAVLCLVLCACDRESVNVEVTPTLQPSPSGIVDMTPTQAGEITPTLHPTVDLPSPSPTPDPTPSVTAVPTLSPTPVITKEPTPTLTPSPTPTATPSPTPTPTEPPEPYFGNPLVEKAVRDAIGNPNRKLEPEDFESVTVLDLSECGLEEVGFLSEFVNLLELDLSWNNLSESPCLPELKHLTKLDLSYNFINEIQVLSSYTELTELSLRANNLTSLLKQPEPVETENTEDASVPETVFVLEGLSKLNRLDLSYNILTDVSELTGLTALEYLNLEQNRIADFTAVEFVPELIR